MEKNQRNIYKFFFHVSVYLFYWFFFLSFLFCKWVQKFSSIEKLLKNLGKVKVDFQLESSLNNLYKNKSAHPFYIQNNFFHSYIYNLLMFFCLNLKAMIKKEKKIYLPKNFLLFMYTWWKIFFFLFKNINRKITKTHVYKRSWNEESHFRFAERIKLLKIEIKYNLNSL